MGKKSKKTKAEKKRKAQEFARLQELKKMKVDVSKNNLVNLNSEQILNYKIAHNPAIKDIAENPEHFILIFKDYNKKECQIGDLSKKQIEAVIDKFNHITSNNPKTLPSSGIVRDDVYNSDQYKELYNRIKAPDVKIKETSIIEKGRIFFYIVQRYFCIVAIQSKHKNIDK